MNISKKQFITHQTRTYTGTSRNRTPVRPRSPEGMRHKNLQGKQLKLKQRIGSREELNQRRQP